MNIESLCKKYNIENYIIRDDGRIDVNGDVYLSDKKLKKLPLKFGHVSGHFYCSYNQLTSLEGCPTSVGGHFDCDGFSALCKNSSIEVKSFLLGTDWFPRLFPTELEGIRMKLIEHAMNL